MQSDFRRAFAAVTGLELLDEIGRGAHSIVYEARGREQVFAVKVQRSDGLTPDERRQFRMEAALLARTAGPGFPALYDAGEIHGRNYLLLERIPGRPLATMLQDGALPEATAIALAKAILRALTTLHAHGVVHRDLNPANIIVMPSGVPRLVDLGLAAHSGKELQRDGAVGTLLYSSLEQVGILKRPVDARSDLYSLGVILFQALTGRTPFVGGEVQELLQQYALSPAPDLLALKPGASPALARVVAKALAKDPDDRYQSALEFQQDLERLEELDRALAQGKQVLLGGAGHPVDPLGSPTPLFGREPELTKLEASLSEALAGHGAMALVEGAPGNGKTRLVRELVRRARERGAWVLTCKAMPGDPLPFAGVKNALASLARAVEGGAGDEHRALQAAVEAAAGKEAPILRLVSPALAQLIPGPAAPAEDLRDNVPEALANFLIRLARPRGAVLFMDDVQWLDDGSREVLRRAVAHLANAPMWVVATARSDSESAERLEALVERMGRAVTCRLAIGSLSEPAVLELVTSLLGGHPVDPDAGQAIFARTGGVPLAVGEYVTAMLEEGLLRFSWGRWSADRAGLEALDLPRDVLPLLVKRMSSLSTETREVLQAAAVLGSVRDLRMLAAASALSEAAVEQGLFEALRAHLMEREEGTDFRFVHDRIREALLSEMGAGHRRDCHGRVVSFLEARPDGAPEFVYALAWHLSEAETQETRGRVFSANVHAGQVALQSDAAAEAYQFLARARRSAGERELADSGFRFAFGLACMRTRRLLEAIEHFREAISGELDPARRALTRRELARAYLANWQTAAGAVEVERALAEVGHPLPKSPLLRLFSALGHLTLGLFASWLLPAKGTARGQTRERLTLLAQLYHALTELSYFELNWVRLIEVVVRCLYPAARLGPSREAVICLGNWGAFLGILQLSRAAEGATRKAERAAEALGSRLLYVHAQLASTWAAFQYSQNTAWAEHCARFVTEASQWIEPADFSMSVGALGWHDLMRGHHGYHWIERSFNQALMQSNNSEALEGHIFSGQASAHMVALGRVADADMWIERAARAAQSSRFCESEYCGFRMFYLHETGQLGAEVEALVERYRRLGIPLVATEYHERLFYILHAYVWFSRCRAADGSARIQAVNGFRRALKGLRLISKQPVQRSHYLLLRAAYLRMSGARERAASTLAAAESLADAIDSPWIRFEAACERARTLRDATNFESARHHAMVALRLATAQGWSLRAQRIQREFNLEGTQVEDASPISRSTRSTTADVVVTRSRRQLDALLEVSLASIRLLQPEAIIHVALKESVRLLNAERAHLFLSTPEGALRPIAGRDAAGNALEDAAQYSQTVVRRVLAERQPLVASGTEAGEILAVQSVVAYGLRSIIAAPLLVGERLLGVIYLDSRVARGVFTREDVDILMAIAHQIGISIENARAAQLALERMALEKDLAVTAAVQSLLLPKTDCLESERFELQSYYKPMAQSGGDWWHAAVRSPSKLRLLLGDVSGHGAGAAMMTAAVAASVKTVEQQLSPDMPGMLSAVDRALFGLASGRYHMTLCAVELDWEQRQLSLWSAGAPAMLLMNKAGTVSALAAAGAPLGSGDLELAARQSSFGPGERLLLCTDGILELQNEKGRPLGPKPLARLLEGTRQKPLREVQRDLISLIEQTQGGRALADDMTFIVLEAR